MALAICACFSGVLEGHTARRWCLPARGVTRGLARLWTQRKGCGPAVQPTRGTVRLDPVHRQPPRAMADAHRGAGLARLYACPAGFDSQEEGWHAAAVPSHGKTRQEALESSFRAWLPLGKRFHHTLFSQRPQLRERDGFAFHRRESAYCGERQRGSDNGQYVNQRETVCQVSDHRVNPLKINELIS